MRLIDADALIEKSLKDANCYMDNDIKHGYHNVQCLIYDAPTIDAVPATIDGALGYLHKVGWIQEHERIMTEDVAPINHGRWEEIDDLDFDTLYRCSVCGEEFYLIDGTPRENQYYYCPCCGSKMDGGGDDE
jgi:DNA-directed RNA polymerase subunit RPC12/RpoP